MNHAPGRFFLVLFLLILFSAPTAFSSQLPPAETILTDTGIKGGVVVHLGSGDGTRTIALHANDSYMVHGFSSSESDVEKARRRVQKAGLYGKVAISLLKGNSLPFIDNLVNLVVADNTVSVPKAELMRVLCPGGTAWLNGKIFTKSRPGSHDEWTHYMYNAQGNAVSNDTACGPPRRLQWTGGPKWGRHHEHMSSVSAAVTSGGRIFYIIDEGSRASIQLPAKWKLVARDAFNGTLLWKRDIPLWYTHLYPLKAGPAFLPRRLVASGAHVYVTLGLDRATVALDAATGETVHTYRQSKATEEILFSEGTLFLLVNTEPYKPDRYTWNNPICWNEGGRVDKERPWDRKKRSIMAVDAENGKTLWKTSSIVAPITLCAGKDIVVFHNSESVVCLDRETGKKRWSSPPVTMRLPLPTCYAPTLVLADNKVLFAGGNRKMACFDAGSGKKLWTAPHYRAGHRSPEDLLVIDGLAWTGRMAGRNADNRWTGYSIETGEVEREFTPDIESYWFHHRCYRSKATTKFLMPSRTGIEYVDWRNETWDRNHWVRGACVYGVIPANGLTYAPQHPCACYIETKLHSFNALAPAADKPLAIPSEKARLQKGPAYGKVEENKHGDVNEAEAWPTFRHDGERSGCVKTSVSAELTQSWRTDLPAPLSSVVVAGGKLYVASIDAHTVHALDAASGKKIWSFTAGGRVDSPPTIYKGRALFGCRDGYVYCLRASDGALAWKYLAARADRRHMAHEQLESVWPVHGSVLVRNGIVYCVAGRSAFLDGGMRFCCIDAEKGTLVNESMIDDTIPGKDKNLQFAMKGLNMPTGLPDVLSCDGNSIYMRSQKFDFNGKRKEITAAEFSWNEEKAQLYASKQLGKDRHLFSTIGFLDGSWFHRSYWIYGRTITSGCNFWFRPAKYAPSGRLMVFDNDTIYSFGRLPKYILWTPALEYRLFAAKKEGSPEAIKRVLAGGEKLREKAKGRWIFNREITGAMKPEELSAADIIWAKEQPPFLVRAMVCAGNKLYAAGPPDVLNEEDAVKNRWNENVQKNIIAQDESLQGKQGALLHVLSTESGKKLFSCRLESMPRWDGMAAACNRLYVADVAGTITCFR